MMTSRPIDLDALRMDDVRAGALRGRPVTVLGAARSGFALTRFFLGAGALVTLYDGRREAELGQAVAELDAAGFDAAGEAAGGGLTILAGPNVDPTAALEGAALVATSPSINPDYPTTEPRLRAALQSLVEARRRDVASAPALVSEADLFLRLCPAPTIGVTGTKGKTTTASLVAAVLAADAVHPVELGGNIGRPLVDLLPELTADHRVVIELSELQLPTLSRGTTVAVYTNVTSDHLDRHGSLEAYRRVKRRLAELVPGTGALVLNADDPIVAGYRAITRARSVLYTTMAPGAGGVGVRDGWIVADGVASLATTERGTVPATAAVASAAGLADGPILPIAELALPGGHNVSNALAAVAVGLLYGLDAEAIRGAVAGFRGVEHRLEPAGEVDGVRFVNDSQGTQPDAVIAALRSFPPPIVLVAGGRDKGIDLTALGPVVAERAVAAVLIGESGPTLEALFRAAGLATTERAGSMKDAVARADRLARAAREASGSSGPATVLLSPAAASFDMFADYEDRGRAFKAAVAALVADRAARAGKEAQR